MFRRRRGSEAPASRVEDQRVRKMRNLLNINRLFAIAIFISAIALVISSIDTTVWNFKLFWFALKLFVFMFELVFLLAGYGIAKMLGYDDGGAVSLMSAIHNALFGGNDVVLGRDIEDWIINPLQFPTGPIIDGTQHGVGDSIYAFFIVITIVIALISGFGFVRECNPALSAISFFAMNIVLGLASLNGKLRISVDFTGGIVQMIFSKLVITAFMIYLFLELSFQASYIYNVIGPNIQRHRRISSNIKRLKEFRMPLMQERQPVKEEEEEEESESVVIAGKKVSKTRLTITTAFSRIRGMVGKKLFRINTGEDWDKMNNRLKNYYNKLEESDPLISISLSASAYTPSVSRLLLIITTGTIFRMSILMVLAWLALNPAPVLRIFNLPEAILNSVEAGQPETIMLVLVPMAVLFMLTGLIVQLIQKRVAKRMEISGDGRVIHSVDEEKKEKRKGRRRRRETPPV